MKRLLTLLAALPMAALLMTACGNDNGRKASVTIVDRSVLYCESTYPYEGGVLIANFGSEPLDPLNTLGRGYILHYKAGEEPRLLIPADGHLSAPRGMYLRDGWLFICDVNQIVVYDLRTTGSEPRIIPLPEGELFVNDLAADGNDLYASVTNTGRIFRIDISDPSNPGEPQLWLSIPGPNGLLVRDGVMYVASYSPDGKPGAEHVIYRIADLEQPVAEPLISVPGQYDGIAFSSDGRTLYVTNWTPAGLTAIDLATLETSPVACPVEPALAGPADISVADGRIYIPDLPNSRVVILAE